jgi:DNA-binding winged helix-turn-helix (wHTH) protein
MSRDVPANPQSALNVASKILTKYEESAVYEFGHFQVDPARGALLKDGELVPLGPKAFELLLLLIQKNGGTVEKGELMKALWPESFVEDSNLTQTVFLLRKALGDDSQNPQYIITVPRRGYRLAAQVRLREDGSRLRLKLAVGGVSAVTALALGVWVYRTPTAPKVDSLVVLPFVNMSADPDSEFFSDGLTEEIINALTGVPGRARWPELRPFSLKGSLPISARSELGCKLAPCWRAAFGGKENACG